MSAPEQFDLIVLGGGTGANSVARACSKAGWRVASVEPLPYGGTCALRGCDPKKMFVAVAESLDWSRRMNGRGLRGPEPTIDWADMLAFKRTFTDIMPDRVEGGLTSAGVVTIHGIGQFVERDVVCVGDRKLRGRYFHIATGARPATLDIPGEELLLTSTQFLEQQALPKRIAFVGGGFISFEFAHIAKRAGAEQVTILHRGARPLTAFDPDLVDMLVDCTRALGIDVRLQTCVDAIEPIDGGVRVRTTSPDGIDNVSCDAVFHGAGRTPNLDALGLEVAGIASSRRGISVTPSMRSVSNPSVFAVGDCADTGAPNLTPVSAYEARVAWKNMLAENDDRQVQYPPIPSVVFTLPPVARVGLSEQDARTQGRNVAIKFEKTPGWYSSLRVAEPVSAYKTLVDPDSGLLLGAHFIGPGAEEQVNLCALAMKVGMTANQLKGVIFAYPSYASDLGSMV